MLWAPVNHRVLGGFLPQPQNARDLLQGSTGHILLETDPFSRYGDMLSAWLEGLDRSGTGNSYISYMFNVVEFAEE